jgi:hypothetical protein
MVRYTVAEGTDFPADVEPKKAKCNLARAVEDLNPK